MKRKKDEVEDLKQAILDTALNVFAEYGYSQTNIKDITNLLGITRNPVYYHFDNKYEIYRQSVEQYLKKKESIFLSTLSSNENFFTIIKKDLLLCTTMAIKEDILFGEIFSNPDLTGIKEMRKSTFEKIYLLKLKAVKGAINDGTLRNNFKPEELVDYIYLYHFGLTEMEQFKLHQFPESRINNLVDIAINNIKVKYGK